MSLIKQLWIAIAVVTLLALGGSLVVSTLNARQYLEQQLNIKNSDNATVMSLAVSFLLYNNSDHEKAKTASTDDDLKGIVNTMLSSQFDTGYYRQIRLVAPDDAVIADFHFDKPIENVPAWFVKLASIKEHPGVAHVQNGWHQFGMLTVESHTSYVYEALWSNTLKLLWWFLVTAIIAGLLGNILLSRITAPLRTLVKHAQAIGERRFITSPEPRTTELKVVVRAMNALSERVRQMLAEEAQRLENLRRQIHEDAVTGLLERRQFLNAFSSQLAAPEAPAQGALLILRIGKLAELNRDLGRIATDKLLNMLAQALGSEPNSGSIGGRLNGSDLALLAPSAAGLEFSSWVTSVAERIYAVADEQANPGMLALSIAAVSYSRNDVVATILSRLDTVLAQAELEGNRGLKIEEHHDDAIPVHTQEQWRTILTTALAKNTFQTSLCPVRSMQGALIHSEEVIDLPADGTLFKVGDFLPWAARFGLVGRMDYAAVLAALSHIDSGRESVAITISAQTLQDGQFVTELITLLRANPNQVEHLWMEVPEEEAIRNPAAFRAFCLAVKPFASKLGIKHAGPHFSALGDLHDLGLDYLKVDTSLLRDIDQNEGNQSFVRGLVMLAHTLGFLVIAEGIDRLEQQSILADLGFDGLAGPLAS
ncbi:MAG: EAL domain-containing protein [Betaproteobacteria bacterium]|jgi:EAL domain-containing protein (putative c-di-GMP-specific phosphodiesterase class I)/GGDEF domain-containing protein|nr:EAL domain-containing protein [Betaproteobacteria bacterium]